MKFYKVCNNPLIYGHLIKILLLNENKQKLNDWHDWVSYLLQYII